MTEHMLNLGPGLTSKKARGWEQERVAKSGGGGGGALRLANKIIFNNEKVISELVGQTIPSGLHGQFHTKITANLAQAMLGPTHHKDSSNRRPTSTDDSQQTHT